MAFGQSIECKMINIFFKIHAENEVGRLVTDRFLFFKKSLYKVKVEIHDVTTWFTEIHILPNISQRKGNQSTKFGELIEYHKRNIFLQKLWGKRGRETSCTLFLKKLNNR